MSQAVDERRALARSGIPQPRDPAEALPKRLLTSRLFWLSVVMLMIYAACLTLLYFQVVPDQKVPGGRVLGLGTEAVPIAAKFAAYTVIPLTLLFLWVDRFRPQRLWVWLMTFGWGACVATFAAAQLNSWAAAHLSILGDGDPATAARAAVYVAPFVEESMKATVLFWLAILMRYQWVSKLSGIVLAGLSGAAFAFVENILYYGRVYRYAAQTYGQVEPETALRHLFVQRGLMTCFAHPLFTSMTGIGLAIALRSKSKLVRIVAPLAGFCAAAFLHMAFNATASLVQGPQLIMMWVVSLGLVAIVIGFIVRQLFAEGRLIRERLGDYVRLGWLPAGDALALSRVRTRLKALWHALFFGPRAFLATLQMQRAETELAYLRDAITRGLIDRAGLLREKDLLARIGCLRGQAIIHPKGRANYPRFSRPAFLGGHPGPPPTQYAPPSYPGPAGIGGNYPATGTPATGSVPLGQSATQYSEVNPTWGPPGR